jgi:formate-dependent nitrite reductase cytochrome c552 subunit
MLCASCHLADGSAEAWKRSPHGGISMAQAGQPIPKAPGCPICHIASATPEGKTTHDTSARVTWVRGPDGRATQAKDADARRDAMTEVCGQCHGPGFIAAAFNHIDATFSSSPIAPKGTSLQPYLFMPDAWPHLSPADQYLLLHLQK